MKQIRKSPEAQKDEEPAVVYYARQSIEVADRFIDEIRIVTHKIARTPGIGSLRFAQALDIHGLRMYPLRDFPYLIFYLIHEEYIYIMRVMHGHRDVFGLLLGITGDEK